MVGQASCLSHRYSGLESSLIVSSRRICHHIYESVYFGRSTLSSLHVSFLLFVLVLPDFAGSITPIQDLPCRLRTSVPRRVPTRAGRRAAHHPPHASPHHKEAKSHHDYHGDRDYPPPSHPTDETVVSPHLNHFLSGVQSVFL